MFSQILNSDGMKKLILSLALLIFAGSMQAQENEAKAERSSEPGNSLLKVNLLSLPLRNFSFMYEHKIAKKITGGLGLRIMPNGGVPMLSTISNAIDDPETSRQLEQLETSNFAITPELRFYLGKQAMRGFYVAPFARYSKYKASMPFEFDVMGTTQNMPLSGDLKTFTGGVQLGAQWKLGGKLYLDWWMLGPQYGTSKGLLDGKRSLNAQEQQALRDELQDVEIPFADTKTTVDANGARMDISGPWAGLRAGLSLGVRF